MPCNPMMLRYTTVVDQHGCFDGRKGKAPHPMSHEPKGARHSRSEVTRLNIQIDGIRPASGETRLCRRATRMGSAVQSALERCGSQLTSDGCI